MAELTTGNPHASSCCEPQTQATCCGPTDKADCCGPEHEAGTCGCSVERVKGHIEDIPRTDMQQWTGCIAGALARDDFHATLTAAGLTDIEIHETHRVHEHAAAAIVRARKP